MNGLSILTVTTDCEDCGEQVTTVVRCPVCSTNYCENCAEKKIKSCHICDANFCMNCLIECEYNGTRICERCFDNLFVTKANYETITGELNAMIKESEAVQDSKDFASALGSLEGKLKGLKNRFGF